MTRTLGIAVYDPAAARPTHTTVMIAVGALNAGFSVVLLAPDDLGVGADGAPRARGRRISGGCDAATLARIWASGGGDPVVLDARSLDVLLLRASPLPDALLLWARLAQDLGVDVRNPPEALGATGHKGWLAAQPGVRRPATILTCELADALAFAVAHPDGVVLKPGRGFGGRGVARVASEDRAGLEAAFAEAAAAWDRTVIVQAWQRGEVEKRLIWLEGALIGAYTRQRAPGDFRHNLRVGGSPEATAILEEDRSLVHALSPALLRARVWLAAIDVLGGAVIEVNTTNPGGIFWSETLGFPDVVERVVESLAVEGGG